MKTLDKVEITPIFLDGYMIDFEEMKDNHIYISEEYQTSTHRCLCGCGIKTVLPLNHDGKQYGWDLIKEQDGTVSFTPSILNPNGCHYIITKNVANILAVSSEPFIHDTHAPGSCPL